MPRPQTAYGADLAFVHEAGFTALAEAAARELIGRLRPRGHLVELGCGGGTMAEALVDAGFTVTGIDASRAMVDIARRRVPTAAFHLGDLRDHHVPACDAVAAIGEVFCYAASRPEDLLPVWQRIHDALRPGGILLFDVASRGRASQPTRATRTGRGWRVEATAHEDGDMLVRTIDTWRDVDGAERHSREVHRLLLLDGDWITATLRGAGFEVEPLGAYDDFALQQGWDAYVAVRRDDA